MAIFRSVLISLITVGGLVASSHAQGSSKEDLILCDCGIGDNKNEPGWSTSRQMNWYKQITWPDSADAYPNAPDMAVEIPFKQGYYPWIPKGATGTMPNGDVWTAYIEDGTPDGFKAGTAVTTKKGGQMLNCWAYRGRPVSAALNKTLVADAICWTAFVCNQENSPPPRPKDMGAHSSTSTASSPPSTSFFSTPPATTVAPTSTKGQPVPTTTPANNGELLISASANPRFINYQNTWQSFISNFDWDHSTGKCIGGPIIGEGYQITIDCGGIQIDEDSHMTLLMIQALRDIGLNSLWFNQNPVVPSNNGTIPLNSSWVVMPESFALRATDAATKDVVGFISYRTKYDGFLTGPCSVCETKRFDANFFNPVIAAMQGSWPKYNSYKIQAQCDPWMVCK